MGGNRGVTSYSKFGRRTGDGRRCFRLYPRRFTVQRLRAKFIYLIKLFKMTFLGRRRSKQRSNTTESRRNLVVVVQQRTEQRMKSFGRSNSFYSEAIADCLEFIKRSSVSLDDYKSINQIS